MAIRKKRKMTPEQKAAAVERLAKAREKRLKANPPEYKNIADSVLALPEDHPLSMQKVKQWIKTQKDLLAAEKRSVRSDPKRGEAKTLAISGYINNMEAYLRHGDWQDLFWGEYAENKMGHVCTHPSYDKNGEIQRTVGVYYKDLGMEWTHGMDQMNRARNK